VVNLDGFQKIVALNPNAYPPPRVPWEESGTFRVLYAGRLHESKGVQTVIEALARISSRGAKVSLGIAGAGPHEAELRRQAKTMEFVRFHGHITQQALSDLMRQSDLLVVPSVWAENSSGVLIHALSQGLPALGSDVGGIPELIEDGHNGYLLPPGDTVAWEQMLEKLASDRRRMAELRSYAMATSARFDPEVLMKRVAALAEEMVKRRGDDDLVSLVNLD
jgi:glycosyltransferase involved in cell wall biosynthesis